VWDAFWTMDRRRTGNGYSANAISHEEIAECGRLYGIQFKPWELRALDAMERARLLFLNLREDEPEANPAKGDDKSTPGQTLTPVLFKALFDGKR
jgi:hypothetical protein